MGFILESPISYDASTTYERVTRRDSPHGSSFSPFRTFKAYRLNRRLSREQSAKKVANGNKSSNLPTTSAAITPMPAERSILFTLPSSLRQYIYSLVINPTGARTLHILLKYHQLVEHRVVRLRTCSANPALDIPCCSARCKSFLDTATGAYRGTFDSIMNLLLVSKSISTEAINSLYSHYEFEFDHDRAVRTFCGMISPLASRSLSCVKFELQFSFLQFKHRDMALSEDEWRLTWEALGRVEGLKRLQVCYRGQVKPPRNFEVLDPTRYIVARDSLSIDVQAPWVERA